MEQPLFAVARAASDLQSSPSTISFASQHEELIERPRASESNRRDRPEAVPAALQSGRRNRLKPPLKLGQRGASTFSQIGCPQEAARVAPARGPPLREAAGADADPSPDPVLPPAFEFDHAITW